MNPGTDGVIQRRARPRPNDCTLPAASMVEPLHGALAPARRARAPSSTTIHHPPGRRALPRLLLDRTRQHDDTRAWRGAIAILVCRADSGKRPKQPAKPTDFDTQACAMRFIDELDPKARATRVSLATSPGHASPSVRASANNTGRLASEITVRS